MRYILVVALLLLLLSVDCDASWWLLAMPSTYQLTLNFDNDYKEQCNQMHYLVDRQRQLCTLSKNMLSVVSKGAQMGLEECQTQFSGRHWNCSIMYNDLVPELTRQRIRMKKYGVPKFPNKTALALGMQADSPVIQMGDVFGGALQTDSREKAYVHAISSAGVAYSITRACAQGHLPSCGCDRKVHIKRRQNRQANWEWGGCSEDLAYGERLSKDFVDSNEHAHDGEPARKLMNMHNNEAGRRAIRRNMQLTCKCHGVSGSCTTKICWRKMNDFHAIGETLYKKFDAALRVKFNTKKHKLRPADTPGEKRIRRRDLVYLDDSPNYCDVSMNSIISTQGRRCTLNSYQVDNCDSLCCNRGYTTKIIERKRDCDCKFVWCCQVKCSTCVERTEEHSCK
uniref:Protein Wnt n=1 Tax=Plectus sambesii TaxID=2011161 RepID=A0A914XGT7_9BILA